MLLSFLSLPLENLLFSEFSSYPKALTLLLCFLGNLTHTYCITHHIHAEESQIFIFSPDFSADKPQMHSSKPTWFLGLDGSLQVFLPQTSQTKYLISPPASPTLFCSSSLFLYVIKGTISTNLAKPKSWDAIQTSLSYFHY